MASVRPSFVFAAAGFEPLSMWRHRHPEDSDDSWSFGSQKRCFRFMAEHIMGIAAVNELTAQRHQLK
jgi:hypothetical protein